MTRFLQRLLKASGVVSLTLIMSAAVPAEAPVADAARAVEIGLGFVAGGDEKVARHLGNGRHDILRKRRPPGPIRPFPRLRLYFAPHAGAAVGKFPPSPAVRSFAW